MGPSEIRLKVDKPRKDVLRSIVTRVAYTRPQRLIVFTGHGAAAPTCSPPGASRAGDQNRLGINEMILPRPAAEESPASVILRPSR